MNFNTTSRIINGINRKILVIETDEPFKPKRIDVIQQTIESENETTYIDWYNAQTDLYKKNLEQDGKYYSWMLIDHKDTTTVVHKNGELQSENKLLKSQIQALTERSEFTDDCIAEMATKVYERPF